MMASFFKECPHPDDKQRKELSRELGLEPLQVKFWFQNKRTQMKVIILLFNPTLFNSDDFSLENFDRKNCFSKAASSQPLHLSL